MRSARNVNRDEAHKAYQTLYIPSITYGLPATCVPRATLDKIQSQALSIFLPKMGINGHHPRTSLYAPISTGGLGLTHLYTEQGVQHTIQALRHLRNKHSELHKPIRAAYSWYHRTAGTTRPPWETPTTKMPHLPQIWIHTITLHLQEQKLAISTPHQQPIKQRRAHDSSIMDKILQGGFTNHEIKLFNLARLYLKAECISDLTNAEGTEITQSVLHVSNPTAPSQPTNEDWPLQANPSPTTWTKFRTMLRRVYTSGDASKTLTTPLGTWHPTSKHRRQTSYWDKANETVIINEGSLQFVSKIKNE